MLPSGARYQTGSGEAAFTVVFHMDAALASVFTRGHLGLLEGYFDRQIDVQGDLGAALAAGMQSGFDLQFDAINSVENHLHEWRRSNCDPLQAKVNARAHYGLGMLHFIGHVGRRDTELFSSQIRFSRRVDSQLGRCPR